MPPKHGKTSGKQHNKIGTGNGAATVVERPVAVGAVTRKNSMKPVPVEMKEELGDLTVVEQFTNTPLLLMPTNPELFPFGSQIAKLYTTRVFEKLELEYVPNTSTSVGGTVMAAVNADPDREPFETQEQLLNHAGSVSSAPHVGWKLNLLQRSNKVPVPAKFNTPMETVMDGSLEEDLHTVADGVLNIAVKGLQSFFGQPVLVVKDGEKLKDIKAADPPTEVDTGKLFVSYKVTYSDPVLEDDSGGLTAWLSDMPTSSVSTEGFTKEPDAPAVNAAGVTLTQVPGVTTQTFSLKHSKPGLYMLGFTTSAFSLAATGAPIQPLMPFERTYTGAQELHHTDFGLVGNDSKAESATLYDPATGYNSGFIAVYQIDELQLEDVPELKVSVDNATSSGWSDYVQQRAELFVARCGSGMLEIPAHIRRAKGSLNAPLNRALFERMKLIKRAKRAVVQCAVRQVMDDERKSRSSPGLAAASKAAAMGQQAPRPLDKGLGVVDEKSVPPPQTCRPPEAAPNTIVEAAAIKEDYVQVERPALSRAISGAATDANAALLQKAAQAKTRLLNSKK